MIGLSYTTIYDSYEFLKQAMRNIAMYAPYEEILITIVGDTKTPKQSFTNIRRHNDTIIDYFDVKAQEEWLKDYPKLASKIPYKSDNRRNLGYLRSLEAGAEVIVSLDDDNIFRNDVDFIKFHSQTGKRANGYVVSSNNDWFNACDLLDMSPYPKVFIRGFPFSKREYKYSRRVGIGKPMVNMGLWTFVPDVNTQTLMELPGVNILGPSGLWSSWLNNEDNIMIDKGTMSIINSQNTSIHKSVVPCYYYPKVPDVLFRFPDIFQGFFVKKCLDAVGDYLSVGQPIVDHKRFVHDLMKDFIREAVAIPINEKLADLLDSVALSRTQSYSTAYLELLDVLEKNVDKLGDNIVQKWFKEMFSIGRVWVDICEELM
jgi:hypothetical protein